MWDHHYDYWAKSSITKWIANMKFSKNLLMKMNESYLWERWFLGFDDKPIKNKCWNVVNKNVDSTVTILNKTNKLEILQEMAFNK